VIRGPRQYDDRVPVFQPVVRYGSASNIISNIYCECDLDRNRRSGLLVFHAINVSVAAVDY